MPAAPRVGLVSRSDAPAGPAAGTHRQRFPSALRLNEAAAFERAFKARGREQGRYFVVHKAPNALSIARLGMVVARRTARTSVVRNSLKRLIREAFRSRQQELSGWDWVVRVKSVPAMTTWREAREELGTLLIRPQ